MLNASPEGPTDPELLQRFLGGEAAALGQLAQRYEAGLLGLAAGLLHGRSDLAQDAVQEAWVRVIRFGSKYAGASSLKTWLYRIVINQCRTMAARNRADRVRSERGTPPDSLKFADASKQASADEMRAAVRAAVARLPAARQEVVLLCYHAGMTHEQAAEILELPLGTLKSRLHAALKQLRAALAQENCDEQTVHEVA